ncbi:hypothetical protein F4808DRAFT_457851 [Astrocystis sublimbata]|nr:hypothetical protein F4808DRAFT_457851 [Astrocystis sublimbata]
MYASTVLSIFLAALAAAAPSRNAAATANDNDPSVVTFDVGRDPDCSAIKYYCTHCNGNFDCDTDPRCDWCRAHHQIPPN